jgi:cytochrome c556
MNNTVCGNFRSFNSLLVALLVSPILVGCGAKPDTHPGQPVTKREAIFHNMLRAFEPMGLMVRGREPYESDKFLKNAVALETLGKQPWSYFTAGSYYSPTRAKPTVWQYPQEFKAKQKDFLDASVQLTHVSLSANLALIRPAYENVVHACNACHDQFRRSGF